MGARLQRHIDGGISQQGLIFGTYRGKGVHLGMSLTAAHMIAFTDDTASDYNNSSHHGVGLCVLHAVPCQLQGRGIQKIREAGIEVTVGVLEEECKALNKRFFTFHEKQRPYILLKWAQTDNGFIDDHGKALAISTPYTKMLVHKLRSEYDAILVGRVTDEREHPQLNVREWYGKNPKRIVLKGGKAVDELMAQCYKENIQSLIVEGGCKTLQSFIDSGLWDEIRVETAPLTVTDGTPAPHLPTDALLCNQEEREGNKISIYVRSQQGFPPTKMSPI